MSRYITQNEDGRYLVEIESMEVCKWKVNEICCNDSCQYALDYPLCKCESKEDCIWFEKEDGIIKEE